MWAVNQDLKQLQRCNVGMLRQNHHHPYIVVIIVVDFYVVGLVLVSVCYKMCPRIVMLLVLLDFNVHVRKRIP